MFDEGSTAKMDAVREVVLFVDAGRSAGMIVGHTTHAIVNVVHFGSKQQLKVFTGQRAESPNTER